MTILDTTRSAYRIGLCLLPTREDGSQAPDVPSWVAFKRMRATVEQMRAFDFGSRSGVGIVAGVASGHRECWDFDCPETFEAFITAANACGLGDVVSRIRAGYEDETPADGRRWIVKYPESVVWQDCTLARRPGRDGEPKVKTLIELPTFAIVAPSNGRVHASGKPYLRRSGDFSTIASYLEDKRTGLIALARSFDQMPRPEAHRSRTRPNARGDRPGDVYNRRMTWPALLEPAEWTHIYDRGDVSCWCRPGKQRTVSATTNIGGSDLFYPFTRLAFGGKRPNVNQPPFANVREMLESLDRTLPRTA